jgi:hypothetical protein
MPFGLTNDPTIFSRIMIVVFREFIHSFAEVYMDDWKIYNLLKEHVGILWLMFDICHEFYISMKLRKCIFCIPHENLLCHIVCREGVLGDPTKVAVILNMFPNTSAKLLCSTLGHIGYYHRIIKIYATITTPLEKLLKKSKTFRWTPKCEKEFDILK